MITLMTINSECYTTGKRRKSLISLVYGLTFLSLVTGMRPDSKDEKTSSANVMVMIRRNHSLTNTYDGSHENTNSKHCSIS